MLPDSIRGRWVFLRALTNQPFVRVLLAIWGLSGAWDLILSEWIPEEYAKRLPKAYQMIAMTLGVAPWGIWAVFGAIIAGLASLEYAFRKTHAPVMREAIRSQSTTSIQNIRGDRQGVRVLLIGMAVAAIFLPA